MLSLFSRIRPGRRSNAVMLVLAVLATSALPGAMARAATAGPEYSSGVKTLTRVQTINGASVVQDTRNVSISVSATTDIRNQQRVTVTWSGAHPTGNIVSNPNSDDAAQYMEYPMVLLQCRGTNPTPQTCWTPYDKSRSSLGYVEYPAWRLDKDASVADQQQFAHEPVATAADPLPTTCHDSTSYSAASRLPFTAANGTNYYGSGQEVACGVSPPEAPNFSDQSSTSLLADNATFAPTNTDGTGSELFSLRDDTDNASLGCSATVACSIVAIPIMGINCNDGSTLTPPDDLTNPANAPVSPDDVAACQATGKAKPGSLANGGGGSDYDLSVTGQLWWSASNWNNRSVIPLKFALSDNVCGAVEKNSVDAYGSELLIQATNQWSAKLCLDPNSTPFKHIQVDEPQARGLVDTGSIGAALGSQAPDSPFSMPTVQAPVAATGFAISYLIDGSDKKQYERLRLTPRLLAKLMTESYPASNAFRTALAASTNADDQALARNPLSITTDPEFIALNPGIDQSSESGRQALIQLGSNSDVTFALTSYINADPEARAWLNGTPDPWGMTVNANYRNLSLPVSRWPLLDDHPFVSANNDCYKGNESTPYLGNVAAPLQRLVMIQQSIQAAQPSTTVACSVVINLGGVIVSAVYKRDAAQPIGRRFVIGVTSLADADRYSLDTAALQSQSTQDPTLKFGDAAGRTFVQPTDTSLKLAASQLSYDDTTQTWKLPYDTIRTDSKASGAYPGFMLVYADVLTSGLSGAAATGFAQFLRYVVGAGQVSGRGVGQLAAGYLPLTKANGLDTLANYTLVAADAVAAQSGQVPPLVPVAATPTPEPDQSAAVQPSDNSSDTGSSDSGSTTSDTSDSSTDTTDTPADAAATPEATPGGTKTVTTQSVGKTSSITNMNGVVLLVLLLVLLAAGPVLAPILILGARARK